MRAVLAALVAAFFLTGCADRVKVETVTVKVPVYAARPCDPEVCRPFTPSGPDPVFHKPDDPGVTSALKPEDERALRLRIVDLLAWGNALLAQAKP